MEEYLNTRKNIEKNIENNLQLKERAIIPAYKLYLIVSFIKNQEIDETLISKKIDSNNPSMIKYKMLLDILENNNKMKESNHDYDYDYDDDYDDYDDSIDNETEENNNETEENNNETEEKSFLELFETYESTNDYTLVNLLLQHIRKNIPHHISIGDFTIEKKTIEQKLIPSLEKKLLSQYKENPMATLDLITSKEKIDNNDYNIIESNLQELCRLPNNSNKEKIVIEKSIFSIIETILKKNEIDISRIY